MRIRLQVATIFGVLVGSLVGATACDNPFANCREGLDCPGDGLGPKSGGAGGDSNSGGSEASGGSKSGGSGGGGATDGGASNAGGARSGGEGGEASGGAPPQPCDDACKDETPFCDEDNDECVGCLGHGDCEDPTKPMCSLEKKCVPCMDDFTCKDTLGLTDTKVCLDGTEDTMTGEQRASTGECVECGISKDCGGAICDPETQECIDGTRYKGRGICDPCIDDRECLDGMLCVEMRFDDPSEGVVGSFCLWRRDAALPGPNGTCGINSRPYATTLAKALSVNGVEADVCAPATTTCPAIKQHRTTVEGCQTEFEDDDACGAAGFNDGKCRLDGNSDPKCTYLCGGPEDCPGFSCFDTGTEKYCAL